MQTNWKQINWALFHRKVRLQWICTQTLRPKNKTSYAPFCRCAHFNVNGNFHLRHERCHLGHCFSIFSSNWCISNGQKISKRNMMIDETSLEWINEFCWKLLKNQTSYVVSNCGRFLITPGKIQVKFRTDFEWNFLDFIYIFLNKGTSSCKSFM